MIDIDYMHKVIDEMLDKFGEDLQFMVCIEEMGELMQAISKYERVKNLEPENHEKMEKAKESIIEESADVINCVSQIARIFGEDKVEEQMLYKLKRVEERMKVLDNKKSGSKK